MHNAAFAALGLNWRYLAYEVHPHDLRAAIEGARAMGFAGLNLTVPHKLLALDMVDELDESAKIWGAVIRFVLKAAPERVNGCRCGNSKKNHPSKSGPLDLTPTPTRLVNSLREDLKISLRDAKVLLLGAGGAGRTAALRLAAEKVSELFLVNRTFSKILEIQTEITKNFRIAFMLVLIIRSIPVLRLIL